MSNTRFVQACMRQSTDRVPVWLMRQAGRYLPAYQALKAKWSFWDLCRRPDLAAQATLDAARYLDTDAAIIFSDITLPGWAMGLSLEFSPGPNFAAPIRVEGDLSRLKEVEPTRDLPFVLEAIERTRRELPEHVSLIGFVGAPLTLAAYMIEGAPTKSWRHLKAMAYGNPATLHALLERVTAAVVAHARAQVEAGCDALQLFDSAAGVLAHAELETFAFAYAQRALEALRDLGVPLIYFARDVGAHLATAARLGQHVLGLDWTVSVAEARRRIDAPVALQGNLDPGVLFTNPAEVRRRVTAILDEAAGHQGFVLNLGHGVLPETPPENVRAVIDAARAWSPR